MELWQNEPPGVAAIHLAPHHILVPGIVPSFPRRRFRISVNSGNEQAKEKRPEEQ